MGRRRHYDMQQMSVNVQKKKKEFDKGMEQNFGGVH